MSSRQEEKERRRQERLAREQAEAAGAARMRRLQLVVGGVLATAVVAAIAIAITSGGGSSSGKPDGGSSGPTAAVPAQKETDLNKAAAAAGCVLRSFPIEGREHTTSKVTYKTNPPTSGNHNPNPAADGIYKPGNEPAPEHYVHTLEHGRIEIQYRPGTSAHVISQLETIFNEKVNGSAGYHTLLFENNTHMPFAIATTAWGHYLGCKTFNPRVFDAIRTFRKTYVDKGPEFIP
jgi:hypothetical protein